MRSFGEYTDAVSTIAKRYPRLVQARHGHVFDLETHIVKLPFWERIESQSLDDERSLRARQVRQLTIYGPDLESAPMAVSGRGDIVEIDEETTAQFAPRRRSCPVPGRNRVRSDVRFR